MYIPDMTERFPEGMDGIDMTDRYFPPEKRSYMNDWLIADAIDRANANMEIPYEENEPLEWYKFEVGKTYATESYYCGGMVYYKCVERTNDTATFSESDWISEMEGCTRENTTYPIVSNEFGDEEIILFEDENHVSKIRAYAPNGFNNLRWKGDN